MDRHLGPDVAEKNPKYRESGDYIRWRNLVDYNVLDSINFTVFVTQTQGLNPSLSFIAPLTSLGGPIKRVIESSDGTNTVANATSNMNNFTLSVGFQLGGTQDRNFVLNYIVDLHRLYDATFKDENGRTAYVERDTADKDPLPKTQHELCGGPDEPRTIGGRYGLNGDLAVEETIENGLRSLDAAPFSPNTAGGAPGKGNQTTATASVSQSAGATGFSAKYDFTLQWGVNGGPNWTLLKFKGPGGGSGANGQLLSYTRQKQDTLISTLAATCKSDVILDVMNSAVFANPELKWVPRPAPTSGVDAFKVTTYDKQFMPVSVPAPAGSTAIDMVAVKSLWRKFLITLAIPRDTTGLPLYNVANAAGAISITTPSMNRADVTESDINEADGTISWSGFANVTAEGTYYSMRGLLMDAQSATGVGYVYLGIQTYKDKRKLVLQSFKISNNAIDFLTGEMRPEPANYWKSLASCGNSGPFLPNGLNILQQLPGGLSSTILQQPVQ